MPSVQDKSDVDHLKQEALALAVKPTKSFHAFALALCAAHGEDRAFLHEVEQVAGIKRRALFYLLNVGKLLNDHDVSEEQAERIGWTKLQIIARYVANRPRRLSQRAMKAKLEIAARTSAHALPAALEAQDAPSKGALRSILLRLPAEQYVDVEAALIACGAERKRRGLIRKEAALVQLAVSHLTARR
jgi:hypothetical protein